MRIAGRLALASAAPIAGVGYHGLDVVIRTISSDGFEADSPADWPHGALVRLRLAGAGVMIARIASSGEGRISANFVNPVAPQRLCKTVGMMAAA